MVVINDRYKLDGLTFSDKAVADFKTMTSGLLDVTGGTIDDTFANAMSAVSEALQDGEVPCEQMMHYLNMLSMFGIQYAEALYGKFE